MNTNVQSQAKNELLPVKAPKRVTLRLVPEDRLALTNIRAITGLPNDGDCLRQAIMLFQQLWYSKTSNPDTNILLRLQGSMRQKRIFLARGSIQGNRPTVRYEDHEDEQSSLDNRKDTLEFRLSENEVAAINDLVLQGAAGNRSDLIRRALGIYLDVVENVSQGWTLHISFPGGSIPITLFGVGNQTSYNPAFSITSSPSDADNNLSNAQVPTESNLPATNTTFPTNIDKGSFDLPISLRQELQILAHHEKCEVSTLVVDILRSKVLEKQYAPKTLQKEEFFEELNKGPFTIEKVLEHHMKYPWSSVIISLKDIQDAEDRFFPTVLKHVHQGTKLYYLLSNEGISESVDSLEERMRSKLGETTFKKFRKLHFVVPIPDEFHNQRHEFVLFDAFTDRSNGYEWRSKNIGEKEWSPLGLKKINRIEHSIQESIKEAESNQSPYDLENFNKDNTDHAEAA